MGYYFFNKCSEEKLPQIEELVSELGLRIRGEFRGDKSWYGYPFGNCFEDMLFVNYLPHSHLDFPFSLQACGNTNHRNTSKLLDVIKKFISICEPDQIVSSSGKPYDMKEFQ